MTSKEYHKNLIISKATSISRAKKNMGFSYFSNYINQLSKNKGYYINHHQIEKCSSFFCKMKTIQEVFHENLHLYFVIPFFIKWVFFLQLWYLYFSFILLFYSITCLES